jgi:hypothetical protein
MPFLRQVVGVPGTWIAGRLKLPNKTNEIPTCRRVPENEGDSSACNKAPLGMTSKFDSERSLIEAFSRQMFRLFRRMTVGALEVSGLDGVADLVMADVQSIADYAKAWMHLTSCDSNQCSIHKCRSPQNLDPTRLFTDIVAIEAKLKDWRAGLYQATRYRQFAHRSYLLIPEPGLDAALRSYRIFEKAGIGLIGCRETFKVYVSSPKRPPVVTMGTSFFKSKAKAGHFLRHDAFQPFTPLSEMSECTALRNNIVRPPLSGFQTA